MAKVTRIQNAPKLNGAPTLTSKPAGLLLNTLHPAKYYVYPNAAVVRIELLPYYTVLTVIQNNEILSRIITSSAVAPSVQFSNGRYVVATPEKVIEVDYSRATITEHNNILSDIVEFKQEPPIMANVEEAQKEKRIICELPEFELDLSVLDAAEL